MLCFTNKKPLLLIILMFFFFCSFTTEFAQEKKENKKKGPFSATPKPILKIRQGMALKILKEVSWCAKNKLKKEGRMLLEEAKVLDPENALLQKLAPKLQGESKAKEAHLKSLDKKVKKLRKWLAGQQKFIRSTELKLATSGPVLCQARTHEMQYLLSLPSKWNKKKKWSVLVVVDGAGCNFFGANRGFKKKSSLPFIIVTPISFSNTNQLNPKKYPYSQTLIDKYQSGDRISFDETGLLAVLKDLQEDCGAKEKIFITGFSGGGNLTWRMVFGHPEKVAGAAPACANFSNPGEINKEALERKTVPIKAFQGEKDPYIDGNNDKGVNLNAEWTKAENLCKENGFENLSRVMLPGVGHSSCATQILDYFGSLIK